MSPARQTDPRLDRTAPPRGEIALVGTGPGDAELLTVRAVRVLAQAGLVLADLPLADDLSALLDEHAEVVDVAGMSVHDVAHALVAASESGENTVRLLPGDVLLSARGAAEVRVLTEADADVEVVPGLSPLTAVPAFAGVVMADAPAVVLLTGAGVDQDAEGAVDASESAASLPTPPAGSLLVVRTRAADLGKTAARLLDSGAAGATPVAVTWAGGSSEQVTVASTLERVESDTAKVVRTDEAVVVVGDPAGERSGWYDRRPLFGWRVLVPRTKEQAGALSERLRRYGAVPVEVPTIAVEPPRSPAAIDRAVKGLVHGRYQWVGFTSANAVRAVVERFQEYGLDARAFAGIKVAAVGHQTAAAIRAFGVQPDLVPTGDQSSEGLLEEWPHHDPLYDPIERVLLPRADIATDTLVAGLTERGWTVEDVTAYRTVRAAPPAAEIRDAIKGGGFDAALFTSSSTLRNLVGIAGKPHTSTVIAVIGPQTAQTAVEHGLRVDVQAGEPSVVALTDALADFALERRARGLPPRPAARANRKPKST